MLDKAQADRTARCGASKRRQKSAVASEHVKRGDGRPTSEPSIEEDLEADVAMSDVADGKGAEATSTELAAVETCGQDDGVAPRRRRARGRRKRGAKRVELWTLSS